MLPNVTDIRKESLKATYENLNRLVKQQIGIKHENTKDYVEYNKDLNVFEKKVNAIIVDSLKLKDGVINGLLSDDLNVIRRVLKCDWFFEDAIPPEQYEELIFPNVSFSTRCKIINKLSKNVKSEEDAQKLFEYARANFGNKYAEMFLPKCSEKFILSYMQENSKPFQHNHDVKILMNICKRFPHVVLSFIEKFCISENRGNRRRHFSDDKYRSVLIFVAVHFPELFITFFEKHYLKLLFITLGKKLTKVFAPKLKNLMMNSHEILRCNLINHSVFFKLLDFDEQVNFVSNLVIARHCSSGKVDWKWSLYTVLPLASLKFGSERARFLESVYYKIYNTNFGDSPKMWSFDVLEILPVKCRGGYVKTLQAMSDEEIIDMQLTDQCCDSEREVRDIFWYLLSCDVALPQLCKLMPKMTTVLRREILLKEMVKNAVINEDADGFVSVLSYILKSHKNDDPRMILRVLNSFQAIPSKMFNVKSWPLIEELAADSLLKTKDYNCHHWFIEKYIRFRLANGLSVDAQVKNLVKLNFLNRRSVFVVLEHMNERHSKKVFQLYHDEIFLTIKNGGVAEKEATKLVVSLISTIDNYNRKDQMDPIDLREFPLLIDKIDELMKTPGHNHSSSAAMRMVVKNPFLWDKYVDSLLQAFMLPSSFKLFLKRRPEYIIGRLESVLRDLFSLQDQIDFTPFRTARCLFDFQNVTPAIEKFAREHFKASTTPAKKINALKMYSRIANIQDFTALVSEYIPGKEKLELKDDNAEFVEVQINVPKVIKNVKPDTGNVSLVLKYLRSDFLRHMLTSFNSASHNTPVNVMLPVLKESASNKSVSCKKVVLQRIADLSLTGDRLKYFRDLWDAESHSSVRSIVLRSIAQLFAEKPSDEIFQTIKRCVSQADEITIGSAPKLSSVPDRYLSEYASLLWEFTDRIKSTKFVIAFRSEMLNSFPPADITALTDDFCEMILRQYLFVENAKVNASNFSCQYLVADPQSVKKRLRFILNLMHEKRMNYSVIESYLSLLQKKSMKDPALYMGVFDTILDEWPRIFDKYKLFGLYLSVLYSSGYNKVLKRLDLNPEHPSVSEHFGKELRSMVDQIPNSIYIIDIVKESICDFLGNLKGSEAVTVINQFLGDSFGPTEAVLAVLLVPHAMVQSYKKKQVGDSKDLTEQEKQIHIIMNKLKSLNDDGVNIYMNTRFGSDTV